MVDLFARTDALRRDRPLSEAEEGGLVQFFELAVELGWKTMAAYLRHRKVTMRGGFPLDVIREAMRYGLIQNGDLWADAVDKRNVMSHTYDLAAFRALVDDAADRFLPGFTALRATLAVAND